MKKKRWQVQHAKQRLSEVIRLAVSEGPQQITLRGEETAWILSATDYRKLTQRREGLVEFFERSPHRDIDLPIERRKDLPRKIEL